MLRTLHEGKRCLCCQPAPAAPPLSVTPLTRPRQPAPQDIYDAKNAVDHLSGFNVCKRYLIVLYYQPKRMQARQDNKARRLDLEHLKAKFGLKK